MMEQIQIEWWQLTCALAAGAFMGFFYFGGLWLTLVRIPASSRPRLLLGGSFLLRLTLTLTGFYLLLPWGGLSLLLAMGGLIMTRQVLLKIKGIGVASRVSTP
ncbi:ATP synthase subunit I [Desulfuromonas sp. AOP6]|uniref:ATP synthase subunit I n=1 Tax=Desulfuromonas sp. AOP6 TaxID=1566351 RepID=UPI001283BCCB|nr:ATP synthase subunit I [Desulfuromonas sp. AOP6]BCA79925.1 hypothetical protein AOP6_1712 [Desulfuromonas sp. AOP6]